MGTFHPRHVTDYGRFDDDSQGQLLKVNS
jgi:hypothetical protein